MTGSSTALSSQATLWNGSSGHAWVDTQPMLDRLFAPFVPPLLDWAPVQAAARVLDVGCGTGATTLALARDTRAECWGIDISAPMVAVAQQRAQGEGSAATFLCADAAVHAFEAGSFDAIVSRFGVMFFDRPGFAFANLRRAVRHGGAMRFIAWRSPEENPFMTAAERAASSLLRGLPPRVAGAPGQFGLAEGPRIRQVLTEGGWDRVEILPIDVACEFPESELLSYATRMGPIGSRLAELDADTRQCVVERVLQGFEPFVRDGTVRFTAACWCVDAWT